MPRRRRHAGELRAFPGERRRVAPGADRPRVAVSHGSHGAGLRPIAPGRDTGASDARALDAGPADARGVQLHRRLRTRRDRGRFARQPRRRRSAFDFRAVRRGGDPRADRRRQRRQSASRARRGTPPRNGGTARARRRQVRDRATAAGAEPRVGGGGRGHRGRRRCRGNGCAAHAPRRVASARGRDPPGSRRRRGHGDRHDRRGDRVRHRAGARRVERRSGRRAARERARSGRPSRRADPPVSGRGAGLSRDGARRRRVAHGRVALAARTRGSRIRPESRRDDVDSAVERPGSRRGRDDVFRRARAPNRRAPRMSSGSARRSTCRSAASIGMATSRSRASRWRLRRRTRASSGDR